MVFILTLLYIAISLLSPAVLPDFLQGIHILEILGGITILCCLPAIGSSKILEHPSTYLVTGVLLAATLSILVTGWLGGALDAFETFVPIVFTFYFIVVGCTTLHRIVMLVYVLCAVALYVCAQGMIAELTHNVTSAYLIDEHVAGVSLYRHRGLGVINDPNDLAQVLVTVIPLLWLRSMKGQMLQRMLLIYLPSIGLAVGIYYTHSRGGILALIAVVLFGLKDTVGVVGSSIIGGLFTVGVLALNVSGGRGMDQDDGGRISLWAQALATFKAHPIFGVGINHFQEYSDNGLTAHNSFVLCLAELGIVGYFFWLGSIVSTWNGLSEIIRSGISKLLKGDHSSDPTQEHETPPSEVTTVERTGNTLPGKDDHHNSTADAMSREQRHVNVVSLRLDAETSSEPILQGEDAARSAKALRTSFVGCLVAALFLSRTYSIIFYILLGLATSLQTLLLRQGKSFTSMEVGPLLKKICYVMACSIVVLYVFIRVRGLR